MLFRKIAAKIESHLRSNAHKILIVEGARQVGKSFIIRHVGSKVFPHFVEINLAEDANSRRLFENVRSVEDFHLILGSVAGKDLGNGDDTLVFLDEIQEYPALLTLLKFLREEGRYKYIASGSMLGITLRKTVSIPVGSITLLPMYPLDFEEFIIANGVDGEIISHLRDCFQKQVSPQEGIHVRMMDLFKRYLITGGMPEAVTEFLTSHNVVKIREIQNSIHELYADDAAKYDFEHKLSIRRIYNMLPSVLTAQKKRLVFKDIEGKKGKRASDYMEDIDYLINSGITLEVKAITNPRFPLTGSLQKNLLKLYLNDVGLLSCLLYRNNIQPILIDESSFNLGALYECVVAMELKSGGHDLFYYDNKKNGEVDFLIDDYSTTSVLPLEVKSGRDYRIHSALNRLLKVEDYGIRQAYVLSNAGVISHAGGVVYMPVYMTMFMAMENEGEVIL